MFRISTWYLPSVLLKTFQIPLWQVIWVPGNNFFKFSHYLISLFNIVAMVCINELFLAIICMNIFLISAIKFIIRVSMFGRFLSLTLSSFRVSTLVRTGAYDLRASVMEPVSWALLLGFGIHFIYVLYLRTILA